jgi:arsenate reductase
MILLLLAGLLLPGQKEQPEPQGKIFPAITNHLKSIATDGKSIDIIHEKAQKELAKVIVEQYKSGNELSIILICTGNSRRSMMGAAMGNASAAYHGLSDLRFYSGGTTPSAFNSRSIRALKEIGFKIEPTGEKAKAGPKGEDNPLYQVSWLKDQGWNCIEFSKNYSDPKNPQKDFIALMVCDEADSACTVVMGAKKRIPVPFADPKAFDGKPEEASKYSERRDDIGRFMLSTLAIAKEQLKSK